MDSIEKERQRKLFLDPRKRGKWLDHVFGARMIACPNYVVDSKSGKKIFDEKEVKRVYVQDGSALLRNKADLPPPLMKSENNLLRQLLTQTLETNSFETAATATLVGENV